ncbi:MAG: hypothetical protein ACK4NW_09695 [Roseinatronobacter sp.]
MRDAGHEDSLSAAQADGHDSAIQALALMSLLAAKMRQEARWPCLVRPVSTPDPNSRARPSRNAS